MRLALRVGAFGAVLAALSVTASCHSETSASGTSGGGGTDSTDPSDTGGGGAKGGAPSSAEGGGGVRSDTGGSDTGGSGDSGSAAAGRPEAGTNAGSSGGQGGDGAETGGASIGGQNDSTGGVTSGAGSGGTAAAGGGAGGGSGVGQPFMPANITIQYVGMGPSAGLEVIAFTLEPNGDFGHPTFYVAVKNSGPDPICLVDVPSSFLDSAGTELARTPGGGALYTHTYDSFGSPTSCLGKGDIGMEAITIGLENLNVSQVAKIEHGFTGNINPKATKLNTVAIENAKINTTGMFAKVTGTLRNSGTTGIKNPSARVFAVDPAGRPYALMSALALVTVPAAATWNFETNSYTGVVSSVVVYERYNAL